MTVSIVIIGIGFLFFLITCWAILDIARKDFGGIEKKVIWAIIALIPFIGPILYACIGYRKGMKPQ